MDAPADYLPFPEANIWDVPQLREKNQLQKNYQNRGALRAPVFYFSINQDSQNYGEPLPVPWDAPDWRICTGGPQRRDGADLCITNVVSRVVPSCDNYQFSAPVCTPGAVPTRVGCQYSPETNNFYNQWQCLPVAQHQVYDEKTLAIRIPT